MTIWNIYIYVFIGMESISYTCVYRNSIVFGKKKFVKVNHNEIFRKRTFKFWMISMKKKKSSPENIGVNKMFDCIRNQVNSRKRNYPEYFNRMLSIPMEKHFHLIRLGNAQNAIACRIFPFINYVLFPDKCFCILANRWLIYFRCVFSFQFLHEIKNNNNNNNSIRINQLNVKSSIN